MKNKKQIVKYIVDTLLMMTLILLMSMNKTGLSNHELIGIGIGIFTIIHIILNFKFIINVIPKMLKKEIPVRTKILCILDVTIILTMTVDVIMGILISKTILTNITVPNISGLSAWHKFISAWLFILVSIHLGFHWNTIILSVKKLFKITQENAVTNILCKIIYAIIGILGIIGLMKQDINKNFILKTNQRNFQDFNQENKTSNSNLSEETSNETQNNKTKSNGTNTTIVSLSEVKSVDDYLGNLHCTGCGRHCILTNPQCGTGMSQQQQAVAEYNTNYNANENQTSNSSIQKEKNEDENEQNMESSITDYVSIMGFVVGGTYYLLKVSENKTKRKNKISNENNKT